MPKTHQKNVIFPDLILKGDSISIRSQQSMLTDKGEVGRIIEIAFWDTGRFYTPQYQISILNDQGNVKYDLEAEKLSLEIVSIISPSMNQDVRPLKKPVPVRGLSPFKEILSIILIIIIIMAIFLVWKKRLKNIYKKPINTTGSHCIARYRLSNLNEKGFAKEFYTEFSHNSNLDTTYIRALEMTTQEIIQNKDLLF